jgi:hypothetical protein
MDWKDAVQELAKVMPKLAFKQQLIDSLSNSAKAPTPPNVLMAQLEVILAVCKQNVRVSQQHGYPGLEIYAKQVEVAVQNVLSALRNAGLPTGKNQQASSI